MGGIMSETVFIFGAGTSASLGAPLMNNFLNAISEVSDIEEMKGYNNDFKLVLDTYRKLLPAQSKFKMGYEYNIEDLFASFELIRLLGLGGFDEVNGNDFISSIRRVISFVIEYKMSFLTKSKNDGNNNQYELAPQENYETFSKQ